VETDKSSEKNAEMNTVDNPNTPTEIGRDDLRTVLPNYDRDAASAKTSAMILYLAWFVIAACLTLSIYIIVSDGENHLFRKIALPEAGSEGLAFIVNILVTILTDSMGFVHASSLRWALYREERLEFNTNVRLFTSARRNLLNRWYTNLIWIICLILCYASTSQIFTHGFRGKLSDFDSVFVNGIAVGFLAFALLGQAVIATLCMISRDKHIPSWSSNPLNNTLALRHHGLAHRAGRCMIAAAEKGDSSGPRVPQHQQKRLWSSSKAVRNIAMAVWALAILAIIWALVITLVSKNTASINGDPWALTASWKPNDEPFLDSGVNDISLSMDPNGNNSGSISFPLALQVFFGLLFTCAVQGLQTMGLHCVELLVNLWRDENVWRAAYRKSSSGKGGARIHTNSATSAITSGPYIVLFGAKAFLHWVLGQSLLASFTFFPDRGGYGTGYASYAFDMVYIRIWVYALVATSLAVFTTFLALRQPGGCQPVTWGHFQTLSDLIDNWDFGDNGEFWWGDKGVNNNGVRHAGTSGNRKAVAVIQMNARYAGQGNLINLIAP
jgi:hypothetical protein